MNQTKVFVENHEINIKENEEVVSKTFEIVGGTFVTKIDTKLEFTSCIYEYEDVLVYLKREDILSDTIYSVIAFDKEQRKEFSLAKLSSSQDVFINKINSKDFYIIALNIMQNYGEITFCSKHENGYDKSSINFSKLNFIEKFKDGLLINCYELIENSKTHKIIKLYTITHYSQNGKIIKVYLDESVEKTVDYSCIINNDNVQIKKIKGGEKC